ncbi:TPA: PHP domain-containing protein [Candidatus Gastranaerophilales bacterium HUM_8]|nr:pHP domain protein [Acinetobacter sp. CAG:196]DAA98070.1 MAG TPA: PHP domain-containing protein [Candidatus Gastranaerophilales bacterium HUM_8]DAB13592.1 MAG TPA: PHP domain-containing protein [Candidatus Gastranaerophilales bacterium HUM_18]
MKDLTEQDFLSGKVNLHIHTNYSDGKADFKKVLDNAKKNGYKLISITDHNTVEGHKHYQDEILITGVEFDCWFGYVFIHLLAYNIDVNHPSLCPFLAKTKAETEGDLIRLFARRNVPELIKAIHEAGGIAVLAHPACYWAISLERLVKKLMKHGLDGIEVFYPYPRFRKIVKFHSAKDVRKIADKYPQLLKTGGTDFHGEVFN